MLEEKLAGKHLTIQLQNELYGISVGGILQIIAVPNLTPIPNTPKYVKGVINLRGKIIPVIDLRLKFGLPAVDYNENTSIVISRKLLADSNEQYTGLIVDTVIEVLDIDQQDIEDPPNFGTDLKTNYMKGMAKVKNQVITLLSIETLLSSDDFAKMQHIKAEQLPEVTA